MGAFDEKYTDQQRDALAHAYEDRKIRPADRVAALAAAGELEDNGTRLEPFQTNPATVRSLAQQLRRRRAGKVQSTLAAMPPEDAVEALRRRYMNAADAMLEAFERSTKRNPAKANPTRLREIGRAIREGAAIPGPGDRRPRRPGDRDPETGIKTEGRTTTGLAAQIEAAHRRSETAQRQPLPAGTEGIVAWQSYTEEQSSTEAAQHNEPKGPSMYGTRAGSNGNDAETT